MDMGQLYGILAVIFIGCVIICFLSVRGQKKYGCCQCPCTPREDELSAVKIEGHDSAVSPVELRQTVGRGERRSNTWPSETKRPTHPSARVTRGDGSGLQSEYQDSSVIFSSNSMCLKVMSEDGEERFEVLTDGEAGLRRRDTLKRVQSIMSNFEEEVLRSVEALDQAGAGMSDSLTNVAGSFSSPGGDCPNGGGDADKVIWIVGEEDGIGSMETTDDEEEHVELFISDAKDQAASETGAAGVMVRIDGPDEMDAASKHLVCQPGESPVPSVLKYRYSMAREEILCCSSNTSSLALESPFLDSDLQLQQGPGLACSFLQATPDNPWHPFMLYRYSVSLEEVQFPSLVPRSPLPFPHPLFRPSLEDEDSDVFYDARSTLGSTRSSLLEQKEIPRSPLLDEPQMLPPRSPSPDIVSGEDGQLPSKSLHRRSVFVSAPSTFPLMEPPRRCSSLQNLLS